MKIAIIGAGNMGGSIARGLAKGSLIADSDIIVSNPSAGKLERLKKEFPSISTTNNNAEAATGADIVILAVKPWLMQPVMRELKLKSKQILISVAAGISFEELAHYVIAPEMAMFRLIPNTAISELESMTLVAARNTNDEQDQFILRLFSEMGTVMLIPEDKITAATALASCGIAYVLKYIQAAMQAGIEMGLRPKNAMQMIAQSLKGAAALIQNNDTHPSVEIDKVTTPGGITIKGINELEHNGFTSAIIKAMKASKERHKIINHKIPTTCMNDQIKQIAERLRGLRDVLELTSEDIARDSDISAEEYRLAETGEYDISVSMLQKIARTYNVALDALMFGEEPKMSSYFVTRAGKGTSIERTKAYKYQSLAAGFMNRTADPFIVTVEPKGDDEPIHYNKHNGQEFNLVLEGRMLINIEGKEIILNQGDSIYFNSKLPHGMKALDGKTVRFLAVIM